MIKIYVINLERSVERRNSIIKKMITHGLTYELFNAIDGINIPIESMNKIHSGGTRFRKYYGRDMLREEAGAALSHLGVYKKIVTQKIDFAIILEDDIEFDNRLNHVIENKEKITTVLKTYDLVLLGYCRDDLNYQKPGDCSYWGRVNIDDVIRIGVPVHWYWAAIGYLISYNGAKKLLDQGDIPTMQADFLTANSPAYNIRLGLLRNSIIWPGVLNDISTIPDRKTVLSDYIIKPEQKVYNKKYLIRKKLTGMNQMQPAKKIYQVLLKKYIKILQIIKTFFLKCSPKQNLFTIKANNDIKD